MCVGVVGGGHGTGDAVVAIFLECGAWRKGKLRLKKKGEECRSRRDGLGRFGV